MRGNETQARGRAWCFTIEPGLYRLGEIGVRIEDDVVVREERVPTSLTSFPRELRIVGC